MTTRKRRTAIAVTVGVWIAALGSAAALTYDLNRPLHWASTTSQLASPADLARLARAAPAEPVSELQSVLQVPTVTIVGKARHRAVVAPMPSAREISQLRCADWRELDMGSGRVQVCQ